MVAAARARGIVTTAHAEQEAGVRSPEPVLLALGVRPTSTQGRDPLANGLAGQAVGQLARMPLAVLTGYSADAAAALWKSAMVWAAQRIADPKMPTSGAAVLTRHPLLANLG